MDITAAAVAAIIAGWFFGKLLKDELKKQPETPLQCMQHWLVGV
jgi:hypothetical protein